MDASIETAAAAPFTWAGFAILLALLSDKLIERFIQLLSHIKTIRSSCCGGDLEVDTDLSQPSTPSTSPATNSKT